MKMQQEEEFDKRDYAEWSVGGRKITKNFHFSYSSKSGNDFFTFNQPSSL